MLEELKQLAQTYCKMKPADIVGKVNLRIGANEFVLELQPETVAVYEGAEQDALFTMVTDEETYAKLRDGTWNGLTAGGRERMSQSAPLDFELPAGQRLTGETLQLLYHLGAHFFSGTYPTVNYFGPEHTRLVHGGHACPIAYGYGIRSAYYTLSAGEQINEDEKDPFYQVFIVIGGEGIAVVDNQEIKLERGKAVHVPPNVTHRFRAKDSSRLELIWIAYGPGA